MYYQNASNKYLIQNIFFEIYRISKINLLYKIYKYYTWINYKYILYLQDKYQITEF